MENITDKKRAIFDSTLELIKENGFHGSPMSLVAKNAGVAAGTIYHYFESKDQLICELYHYNRSRVVKTINTAIAEELPYKEKLFKIWRDLYEFYIHNTNVLIFFEQYVNSPYNTNKCPSHFQGELYDFLLLGTKKGLVKKVRLEILVVLTLASISSAAKLNMFGNVALKEDDLKQLMEILWDGISIH